MRASALANLLESTELDMPRALDISTRRALLSAVNEVDLRGVGLDDSVVRLRELMLNGTIYGSNALWMNDSTLPEWIDRVSVIASKRGFSLNMTVEELTIEPYDSFTIRSRLRWNITVNDSVGSMTVARNLTAEVLVPLRGTEDPMYLLGTRGLAHRSIYSANFTVLDLSSLDNAISGGYYMNTSDAPSFLGRLEGSLTPLQKYLDMAEGQIGMETFVNLPELYSAGVDVKANHTMVDHLYFGDINITGLAINGSIHDWFRIDEGHAETYGVDGLLIPG